METWGSLTSGRDMLHRSGCCKLLPAWCMQKTDKMPWDPTVASTPLDCPEYSGDTKSSSPLPQPLAQDSSFIGWGTLQQSQLPSCWDHPFESPIIKASLNFLLGLCDSCWIWGGKSVLGNRRRKCGPALPYNGAFSASVFVGSGGSSLQALKPQRNCCDWMGKIQI